MKQTERTKAAEQTASLYRLMERYPQVDRTPESVWLGYLVPALQKISRSISRLQENDCSYPDRSSYLDNGELSRYGKREAALYRKAAALVAESMPGFLVYEQGDCRGAALYVYHESEKEKIDCRYNTVGVAIF